MNDEQLKIIAKNKKLDIIGKKREKILTELKRYFKIG